MLFHWKMTWKRKWFKWNTSHSQADVPIRSLRGAQNNVATLLTEFFQQVYSPGCDEDNCLYHPGVPIFHEGMKFWSCCQRKTSDFTAFLNQAGCTTGQCKWKKESVSLLNLHSNVKIISSTIFRNSFKWLAELTSNYGKLGWVRLTSCLDLTEIVFKVVRYSLLCDACISM